MSQDSDVIDGTDLELYEGDEPEEVEAEETAAEIGEQIVEAVARVTRLSEEAAEITPDGIEPAGGGALVPTTGTAASAKKQLGVIRAQVAKQQALLQAKQDEIRAASREVEALMDKQLALATAALEPFQKMVKRLEEGIWMVNLYLGRDEQIVTLYDGEPAAASERVAIRQLVLAMDQECAVNPDDDGIDATNIDEFDEWLQEDWAHVEQVIPNAKGVVALRPRFEGKSYGDPWKTAVVDEANKQTYFLIRNGGKVYRTWTEFNVGERLVPKADEFASYFYETKTTFGRGTPNHRIPITPGTQAWERAEEASDARQRHYMRVGLILQGLVDRSTVFHPLPEGGINFLDFEHSGRSWEFVIDAENLLTSGRPAFYDWLREKNRNLRVGMRVVGSFARNYSSDDDRWEHRIHPHGAERPPSAELLTIEEQTSDGFIVRYKRTEEIYDKNMWVESKDRPGWGHRGGYKMPKTRASCLLFPDDSNLIAFDLVTEEEMTVYLNARLDRHAYAYMFPLLKAAIIAKRAEREAEEPFRVMLAGVLARDNGVEVADALAALDSLIEWWKLTNKNHRPLVGDEKSQAKAVRMIVAEHARRVKAERKGVSDEIVAMLLKGLPDALVIGRSRDGRYAAFVPHGNGPFVARHNFTARGIARSVEEWKLLRKANLAPLTIAYESDRFADWDMNASLHDHLTGPEFDGFAERVVRDSGENVVAVAYHPEARAFYIWRHEHDAVIDEARPLSGEHEEVKVEEQERAWERKGRVAILEGKSHYSNRPKYTYQRKPWDTRPRRGVSAGWWNDRQVSDAEMAENKYVVVFHDAALDERVEAERERYAQADDRRDTMLGQVRALMGSIEAAWVKRREAEEYAKFLEDYIDPELWDGHRKLLPRETFEYPHDHRSSGRGLMRDVPDALWSLITHAVEQGIDLDGMTVWEAATAHFPPLSFFNLGDEYEVIDGNTGKRRMDRDRAPEAIDIPEDIRGLKFKTPEPDPEPDDDEESDEEADPDED